MKLKKNNFFSISIDCKKTLLFKQVLCLNVSARTCNSLQNNGRIHQSEGLEGDDFYTMFKVPVIVSTFYYFSYEHKKHISEFDFFSFKRSDAQTTDFANFYES
jgi:hypothetical protein